MLLCSLYVCLLFDPERTAVYNLFQIFPLKTANDAKGVLTVKIVNGLVKSALCSFNQESISFIDRMFYALTNKNKTAQIHTVLLCLYLADPATLSSFKQCSGGVIFLREQCVYSVMEKPTSARRKARRLAESLIHITRKR